VRTESPTARPMAATATPAAYRHIRRTLVTTPRATSGNLAPHARHVHVRERPQSGQMSTRPPLIRRSVRGFRTPSFHLLPHADSCARPGLMCPARDGRSPPASTRHAGRSRGPDGR
jgi:hypothetical protein